VSRKSSERSTRATERAATLRVRLQPRASRNEIAVEREGALVVRVTAPPVDGRANDALRKLVAKRLGIAPGRVRIVSGERSREKLLRVEGLDPATLRARRVLARPRFVSR
jgi:hypothetical protein